MLLLVDNEIRF